MLEKVQSKLEAVFISDLHLHPDEEKVTARFYLFLEWASKHTQSLYILGDFFHVWPGDDGLNAWSHQIADRLNWLSTQGVAVYFMRGNRDFLVGDIFAKAANFKLLQEPYLIHFKNSSALLAHGDKYCTQDTSHQWFRKLTRNSIFPKIFLKIPFSIRTKLVQSVRSISQNNRSKPLSTLKAIPEELVKELVKYQSHLIIHGHTHQPGLTKHSYNSQNYLQYILSDWDDIPAILCYDNTMGYFFDHSFLSLRG